MADPVSWKVVEPGWRVVDEAGEEIGRVHEVTGDAEADIFDGVRLTRGLLDRPEYVPSERVVAIREGEVVVRGA